MKRRHLLLFVKEVTNDKRVFTAFCQGSRYEKMAYAAFRQGSISLMKRRYLQLFFKEVINEKEAFTASR